MTVSLTKTGDVIALRYDDDRDRFEDATGRRWYCGAEHAAIVQGEREEAFALGGKQADVETRAVLVEQFREHFLPVEVQREVLEALGMAPPVETVEVTVEATLRLRIDVSEMEGDPLNPGNYLFNASDDPFEVGGFAGERLVGGEHKVLTLSAVSVKDVTR